MKKKTVNSIRLTKTTKHVVIQNRNNSIAHIESKSDIFDYVEKQIQDVLSLIPLFKSQYYSEERIKEKENDVLMTVKETA